MDVGNPEVIELLRSRQRLLTHSRFFLFFQLFHLCELEVVFFAPGEEGFELLLIFGVFCIPLVDGLFAALVDSGFPFLTFALVLGCFYGRVPGLVFGWLETGFERGSDARGVLGFVFGDLVSVDVVMVVGLFLCWVEGVGGAEGLG